MDELILTKEVTDDLLGEQMPLVLLYLREDKSSIKRWKVTCSPVFNLPRQSHGPDASSATQHNQRCHSDRILLKLWLTDNNLKAKYVD